MSRLDSYLLEFQIRTNKLRQISSQKNYYNVVSYVHIPLVP